MQNSKCFQNKLTINSISLTIIIIKKDKKLINKILFILIITCIISFSFYYKCECVLNLRKH